MTVCTEEPEKVAILIIDELLAVCHWLLLPHLKDYRSCTIIGIVQVHRLDFVTVFFKEVEF